MAMQSKAAAAKAEQKVVEEVVAAADPNTVTTLPVSLIDASGENYGRPNAGVREDPEKWTAFTKSIKKYGVLVSVIVGRYNVDTGKYPLIAGNRRLKAAKEVGVKNVPVKVYQGKTDDKLVSRLENMAREELNPLQKAKLIQSMLDDGMTRAAVAEACGMTTSSIVNYLKFLELDDKSQKSVVGGYYTFAGMLDLKKIQDVQNPEVVAKVQALAEEKAEREKARAAQKAAASKNLPKVEKGKGGKGRSSSAVQSRHVREAAAEVAAADPEVKKKFEKAGGALKAMVNQGKTIDDLDVVVETYFTDDPSLEAFATLYNGWKDGSVDGETFANTFKESFGLYETVEE